MKTSYEDHKHEDNRELLKQQAEACGPECGCHATGISGRMRWVVGSVVLVAAAAMAARAIVKNNSASVDPAAPGFADLAGTADMTSLTIPPANDASTNTAAGKEISALSELNTVAADTNAVFVFLPDRKEKAGNAPTAQIQSAVRTIEARGSKIGVFILKPGGRDYERITAQVAVPGVLAMVKGRGMKAVSGEITETKLVQAFVGASSGGGCGSSAKSGCCPR